MEQTGEYPIEAGRAAVWQALNDPEVLRACIDGCEAFERTAENRFEARVRARVGPVNAVFTGELELRDLDPPNAYVIVGSGKGGAAGFARGEARVQLLDHGSGTLLRYALEARVGGKLAQVGQRLVDGAARKMADDFFARFRDRLAPAPAAVAAVGGAAGATGTDDAVLVDDDATVPEFNEPAVRSAPAEPPRQDPPRYEAVGQRTIWLVAFGTLALVLLLTWGF